MAVTQSYDLAPQASAIVALALVVNSVVAVAATPVSAAMAVATLTGATASFRCDTISAYSAISALSGATLTIGAAPVASVVVDFAINGRNADVKACPASVLSAWCSLSGATATISASSSSACTVLANLTGASDSHGMSVPDVVKEMLGLCGIFGLDSAPDFALEWAINGVNASLQTVWNHAEDRNYWSSDTMTIALADGVDSFDLPNDIQNVVGPCRRADNLRPLVPIGTIGELETFSDLYLDGETAAEPLAYHINRMAQAGNDPAKCVFNVTPAVAGAALSFLLEVVREAPRYTFEDLRVAPVIPIPHRYVESLLLPIVRYHASSFSLFIAKDQKETIDRNYQAALVALGLADPLPGKAGDNINKREQAKS